MTRDEQKRAMYQAKHSKNAEIVEAPVVMGDSLTIYVNRGQFVWESDMWRGSDKIGSCTGPTLAGVIDLVYEIISESDPQWADFNANEDFMTHDESCQDEICDCDNPIPLSRPVTPHEELLIEVNRRLDVSYYNGDPQSMNALRAVVKLHKPSMQWSGGYDGEENPLYVEQCQECSGNGFSQMYPCPTIQAIKAGLKG